MIYVKIITFMAYVEHSMTGGGRWPCILFNADSVTLVAVEGLASSRNDATSQKALELCEKISM